MAGPRGDRVVGFDGVGYQFATCERGRLEALAEAWSPPEGSPAGRLVAIAGLLAEVAESVVWRTPGVERELAARLEAELARY